MTDTEYEESSNSDADPDQASPIEDSDDIEELSEPEQDTINRIEDIKYVLRMTPDNKFHDNVLIDHLSKHFDKFILAVEVAPKEHFHAVIWTEMELQDVRDIITEQFLYHYWPVRGRGFGNAQYNLQVAKTEEEVEEDSKNKHKEYFKMYDRAVSYCVKDHDIIASEGLSTEYIDKCIDESFAKKDIATFKIQLRKLEIEFKDTPEMGIDYYMIRYIQLKAKYEQAVRLLDAHGHALSALIRRDPKEASDLVEAYLYKY